MPMSGPERARSRITGAMREDAERNVGGDLDLWPGITERLGVGGTQSMQDPARRPSRVAGTHDTWSQSDVRAERASGRGGTGNLNLVRSLPAMALTVAMILLIVAGYILPSRAEQPPIPRNKTIDGCSLITQQEADSLAGRHMEQSAWQPVKPRSYACTYYAEEESINVLVASFQSQQEARDFVQTLSANATTFQANGRSTSGNTAGDETYTRSRKPGNEKLNFWDVIVGQQSRYIIVTWMTTKPDPTEILQDLANKVVERLGNR